MVATSAIAGAKFGRYEIIKHLATGGMAELLLARTRGLEGFERHVVIKRIRADQEEERRFVDMFLTEARLSATLHHHNIVQVHDIGEEDGKPYFAMEYVHGEDLRRLLHNVHQRGDQVPIEHIVAIASATAIALHHAHEQLGPDRKPLGLVHRDVTPANILVGYDGNVKVVDFGIAKATMQRSVTQAGMRKGKAPYMSPEQCAGGAVDRRSDVFALGIVLHEFSTVRRLFKGSNEYQTMGAIVRGHIPTPSTYRPDLPKAFDAIVMRALERDPAKRFPTAQEMFEALEAFAIEAGLRTSSTGVASYMRSLFGERPEPWLAEDVPDYAIQVDFDGSEAGLAPAPDDDDEDDEDDDLSPADKSSPIARARTHARESRPPTLTETEVAPAPLMRASSSPAAQPPAPAGAAKPAPAVAAKPAAAPAAAKPATTKPVASALAANSIGGTKRPTPLPSLLTPAGSVKAEAPKATATPVVIPAKTEAPKAVTAAKAEAPNGAATTPVAIVAKAEAKATTTVVIPSKEASAAATASDATDVDARPVPAPPVVPKDAPGDTTAIVKPLPSPLITDARPRRKSEGPAPRARRKSTAGPELTEADLIGAEVAERAPGAAAAVEATVTVGDAAEVSPQARKRRWLMIGGAGAFVVLTIALAIGFSGGATDVSNASAADPQAAPTTPEPDPVATTVEPEPEADPVADPEPVAAPEPEPVVASEPAVEPTSVEPVAEPVAEPVDPAVEPVEPVAEPVVAEPVDAAVEPGTPEPIDPIATPTPVVKPKPKRTAKPKPKPAAKPKPKPAAKPTVRPNWNPKSLFPTKK